MFRSNQSWAAIVALVTFVTTAVSISCQSAGNSAVDPAPTVLAGATIADQAVRDALLAALDDERRAEATYAAAMRKFGQIRPFSNIIQAEVQHQRLLLPLLEKYGITAPPNPYDPTTIFIPDTVTEACALGATSERDNIAIYDRLIPTIDESDIRSAFDMLRSASANRHLPAFERCANRDRGTGPRWQG